MSVVPLVESTDNLPAPRSSLVGRERELGAARALLLDEAVPLLTLTGPGGVGKTRLALAVAAEVASSFADGIAFVDLAPIVDPDLVLPAVVQTLGLREQPDRRPADLLAAYLRPKQFLLVLDNFEQVLVAAPAVADLLAACPALQLLVTSRSSLRVSSEYTLVVPPLALPHATVSLPAADLAEIAAVNLFVQRARAANHAFALTDANAPVVSALCRGLDGLPLALELAAARLRYLSPQALLALLSDRLRLLVGGVRDAPTRLQTMRDAIAWSYDLLDPDEQTLFRRLSVFAGGFTLDAAEAVCASVERRASSFESAVDVPPADAGRADGRPTLDAPRSTLSTLDGIAALIDHSLLVRIETAEGERFGMLETLRTFALEQLERAGETAGVQERHTSYFVDAAETARRLMESGDDALWLDRLDADHDNLRAVLTRLRDRGDVALGLRLAGTLGHPFWTERGFVVEGRTWLDAFLASAAAPTDAAGGATRTRALLAAGRLAWMQGDYGRATAVYGDALALARTAGDRRGETDALNGLGVQEYYQGQFARARELEDEGLAVARALDDNRRTADALHNLGELTLDAGDAAHATASLEESIARYRAGGHRSGVARALIVLGDAALVQGDLPRAASVLGEAVALAGETRNRQCLAKSLSLLGCLAHTRGEPGRAAASHAESLRLWQTLGDRLGIAQGLLRTSDLLAAIGQPEPAVRLLAASRLLVESLAVPPIADDLFPVEQVMVGRIVGAATRSLGDDGFARASNVGRSLSAEQAIAEALAHLAEAAPPAPSIPAEPVPGPSSVPPAPNPFGLSPRERDVLRHLVQRLTDKQIAEELYVSHRTVMSHVASILGKLGVANRRQAGAEAVRLGLV